jgi:hypothetical protein
MLVIPMYDKRKFEGIFKCQIMLDTQFDAQFHEIIHVFCTSAGDDYVIKRQLIFTHFLMMLTW